MARVRLVAGNWKMHGSRASNAALLDVLVKENPPGCAVCVPFPYLAQAAERLRGSRIAWGAQNVSEHAQGAYTGEVSAAMAAEFGCRYVIVGHSERRTIFAESDEVAAQKYVAARKAGLTPIFCVGETLEERDRGVTEAVLARQVDALVGKYGAQGLDGGIVAYEPVWAIGTGRTATSKQADEAQAFIRARIAAADPAVAADLRILYGGSVKAGNAAELFAMPNVDGGLVGGASLVAKDFAAIWRAAVSAL